jgi:uncharacterized protein (DUF1697 family)
MQTYISLLRGINVSGSKMIKMELLKQLYQDLLFTGIQTYIQSGNVIFASVETDLAALQNQISDAIKTRFGYEVPVCVLRYESLLEILKNNPFVSADPGVDVAHLYLTFLNAPPADAATQKLKETDFSPERLALHGQVAYLYLPNGYGRARLNNNLIETRLKTSATTRNWKTLNTLATMARENL